MRSKVIRITDFSYKAIEALAEDRRWQFTVALEEALKASPLLKDIIPEQEDK